jgi:hypothetical protein
MVDGYDGVPRVLRVAALRRRGDRTQRPGLPGEDHRVQRATGQLRDLLRACDITAGANALAVDGHPIDTDELATISRFTTHTIRRFGGWVLDLLPLDVVSVTTLDLVPDALFLGDIIVAPAATALRRTRARVTAKKVLSNGSGDRSPSGRGNHLPCLVGRLFLVLEFRAD